MSSNHAQATWRFAPIGTTQSPETEFLFRGAELRLSRLTLLLRPLEVLPSARRRIATPALPSLPAPPSLLPSSVQLPQQLDMPPGPLVTRSALPSLPAPPSLLPSSVQLPKPLSRLRPAPVASSGPLPSSPVLSRGPLPRPAPPPWPASVPSCATRRRQLSPLSAASGTASNFRLFSPPSWSSPGVSGWPSWPWLLSNRRSSPSILFRTNLPSLTESHSTPSRRRASL